jgi:GNAT superfamily N-acetyltransferase
MYWADRELIRRAFRRAVRGTVRMLVADADGHPVGQIWIDLTAKAREGIAVLWALRTHPMFCGKGLGSQLMNAAERVARREGFGCTEVGVEHGSRRTQRFYRRLGYARCGRSASTTSWRRPDGKRMLVRHQQDVFRKALV